MAIVILGRPRGTTYEGDVIKAVLGSIDGSPRAWFWGSVIFLALWLAVYYGFSGAWNRRDSAWWWAAGVFGLTMWILVHTGGILAEQ